MIHNHPSLITNQNAVKGAYWFNLSIQWNAFPQPALECYWPQL